jgi:hypothetical protein
MPTDWALARRRCVAAAVVAAAAIAGSTGCSHQGKVPQKTARVSVNDESRTSHAVSCTQVQWLLTVNISAAPAQVRAVLQLEPDGPKSQSVNIDDFNGFTGVADVGVGKTEAAFSAGTYHITGTARGSDPEKPGEKATADFTIDTTC